MSTQIKHRNVTRSDVKPVPYEHVDHTLRSSKGRFVKGARLYRVPCWRAECSGWSVRKQDNIESQLEKGSLLGCSTTCTSWRREREATCYTCGLLHQRTATDLKRQRARHFCSKACYTTWQRSEENAGELHPNYESGPDPNARDTKSQPYRHWRDAVFARDGYACRMHGPDCTSQFHAHHIVAFKLRPDLELDFDNGITLCVPCHRALHAQIGLVVDSTDYLTSLGVIGEASMLGT